MHARHYVDELIRVARQLFDEGASIGDLKIVAGALRELAQSFRLFADYGDVRKVTAFGSARTPAEDPVSETAERFSQQIADAGFMVITGAGPGIMEACQRGAGRDRSFGMNIRLPMEQAANDIIHGDEKLITFRYFFARKLMFLKEADAVVLFPGGFGTLDEGFETLTLLQTGKTRMVPVIMLDRPNGTYWKAWQQYTEEHLLRRGLISVDDLALYRVAETVEEAVEEITRFYRVYHSSRFVGDKLVIRLERALSPEAVAAIDADFRDILSGGTIEASGALPGEHSEPDLVDLPRLVLEFDRIHYGRLRQLIDRVNAG
jgi:hypothetical protein